MKTGPKLDLRVLCEMLTYKRPAGSKTERRFIRAFIEPLGVTRDEAGNLFKRIGRAPVLWSCHTDTVHKEGGTQLLEVNGGTVSLAKGSNSGCLGADDTAGVWLMCEMIRAKRPGLYVFHRGEEIGGVGSSHIATKTPNVLAGIKAAIALDRASVSSVITHQWGGRCCSDTFGLSLAAALNANGLAYELDTGGSFTDTANYTELVGECTNLSIGYDRQHTAKETLDLYHVAALRNALLTLDTGALVYERQPGEVDPADLSQDNLAQWYDRHQSVGSPWDEQRPVRELIRDNAAEIADLLDELGYDAESIAQEIWVRGGIIPQRHM